jgi:hypothetical protein
MSARRDAYRAYLRSPQWAEIRKRERARAGERCEFIKEDEYGDGPRCSVTRNLQVHHLTYANLGREQPGDLKVLCDLHHKVYELVAKECVRCQESVFDNDSDSAAVELECAEGDLETAMSNAPGLCPYCDHMCNKDD